MGAHDRAAAARARMDRVRREMAERRALRTRNARAVRERAQDSLKKQGPVAAQVAKHMGELGRRAAKAGGWATEKTQRDTDYIMGFGTDDERAPTFAYRPKQDKPRPGGIGSLPEDDEAVGPAQPEPAPAPPPPTPRSAPPPPAPPPPPPPARRPVREREVLDDEDDFSNQSTWMRKR